MVLTETLVQNPDPQVRASRAGVGIAAPIYTLLLSLVIADAKRHDEGGRCVVAQERLAQLRAQIAEVEQEVQAACSAGVALDPPRPTWEEAAGHVWAGEPLRQPLPDAAASTTLGGRRRQTSGPAPPSSTSTNCTVQFATVCRLKFMPLNLFYRGLLFSCFAWELLVYWNACPYALRCLQHGIILTIMLDTSIAGSLALKHYRSA